MGIVIDTNVFIDAENGRFDLAALAQFSQFGEAFIAAVTVSELLCGVHLATDTDQRVRRSAFAEAIIGRIPVLAFNEDVARTYAELYAHALQSGGRSGNNAHDLQIAATAIAHGFPVLTSNSADFNKIPGLDVYTPSNSERR